MIKPDAQSRLCLTAYRWWCMRRPLGWTESEHLNNPTINANGSDHEKALAFAVANFVLEESAK